MENWIPEPQVGDEDQRVAASTVPDRSPSIKNPLPNDLNESLGKPSNDSGTVPSVTSNDMHQVSHDKPLGCDAVVRVQPSAPTKDERFVSPEEVHVVPSEVSLLTQSATFYCLRVFVHFTMLWRKRVLMDRKKRLFLDSLSQQRHVMCNLSLFWGTGWRCKIHFLREPEFAPQISKQHFRCPRGISICTMRMY